MKSFMARARFSGKMAGDTWQKFANLRAYLLHSCGRHPGKKLLFMGGELAQAREWNYGAALDWSALDLPFNAGVQRLVSDLNQAYRGNRALHARDTEAAGFSWIEADSAEESDPDLCPSWHGCRPADRGGRQFHARSACEPKNWFAGRRFLEGNHQHRWS